MATAKEIMGMEYPNIEIREEEEGSFVYRDDQLLVSLKENRFLRFRATPADEIWMGCERGGFDLGWAYRDPNIKGLEVLGTAHEHHPEKGEFALVVKAKKPQFDSAIDITFRAVWMPEAGKFKFTLYTSLQCPLENWYANAFFCHNESRLNLNSLTAVEVTDYRVDRISIPECLGSINFKSPVMYEWFVQSRDGANWEKWPKTYVAFPIRPGNYITIRDLERPSGVGACYGFLDQKYGGWMTRIEKASSPVMFEICWALFDVHMLLIDVLPPRHSQENLFMEFEMSFEALDASQSGEVLDKAEELPWRSMEEYKLPLFSMESHFETLLSDLPAKETQLRYAWWATGYDCYRDHTTGYGDSYSVTIKREGNPEMPAAWYAFTWGPTFDGRQIRGKRFRFSAMVKTQDCNGQVRLAMGAKLKGDAAIYVRESHNSDGTLNTERMVCEYSEALTGTNDWTRVSMEFTVPNTQTLVIMEQLGGGQCWFDDVRIEEISEV